MKFDKGISIFVRQGYIIVYLNNELFLKQKIIKNIKDKHKDIDYTFFFIILILQRFGLASFS